MGRGMLDVIAPREEEGEYESADPSADPDDMGAPPKQDPQALISGIEAQLAQLRQLMAGL